MRKQRIRRLESLAEQLDASEPPPPRRLQTAQDVIDLLHEQIEALRASIRRVFGEPGSPRDPCIAGDRRRAGRDELA